MNIYIGDHVVVTKGDFVGCKGTVTGFITVYGQELKYGVWMDKSSPKAPCSGQQFMRHELRILVPKRND